MDREQVLVRIAVSELGPQHWPAVQHAIEAVGLGPLEQTASEATLRKALLGDEPTETSRKVPLDSLIRKAFSVPKDAGNAAGAVTAALRAEGLSLDAANLAGIEDYRERWELELSSDGLA